MKGEQEAISAIAASYDINTKVSKLLSPMSVVGNKVL